MLAFTVLVLVTNIQIFFISSGYSLLLILFDIASILLWFITLAVTSGIVLFPAESEDFYGSFLGLISNPVDRLKFVIMLSYLY